MQVRKQQLEPDMEQQTGSKLGKEYVKAVYCHPVFDTTLMAESEEELKSLLMKVKKDSEKAWFKLNVQKIKIIATGSITSWQIDGETVETVTDVFLGLQNHYRW